MRLKEYTFPEFPTRPLPVHTSASDRNSNAPSPRPRTTTANSTTRPTSSNDNSKNTKLSHVTSKYLTSPSKNYNRFDQVYIKTLQQQIEVLELETKHLKDKYQKGDFTIPKSIKTLPGSNYEVLYTEKSNDIDSILTGMPLQDPLKSLRQKFTELHAHYANEAISINNDKSRVQELLNAAERKISILLAEKDSLACQVKTLEDSTIDWTNAQNSEYLTLRDLYQKLQLDYRNCKEAYDRLDDEKSTLVAEKSSLLEEIKIKDKSISLKDKVIDELNVQLKSHLDMRREEELERNIGNSLKMQIESLQKHQQELQNELAGCKVKYDEMVLNHDIQVKRANEAVERFKVAIQEGSQWKAKYHDVCSQLENYKNQVEEIRSKVTGWDSNITSRRVQVLQKVEDLRDRLASGGSIVRLNLKKEAANKTSTDDTNFNEAGDVTDNIDQDVQYKDSESMSNLKMNKFDIGEVDKEWLENDATLHFLLLYLHKQSAQLQQVDEVVSSLKASLEEQSKLASSNSESEKRLSEAKELLEDKISQLDQENVTLKEQLNKLKALTEDLHKKEEEKTSELAALKHAYDLSLAKNEKAEKDYKKLQELQDVLRKVEEWKYTARENERAAKEVAGFVNSLSQVETATIKDPSTAIINDQDDLSKAIPSPPPRRSLSQKQVSNA